MTAPALANPAPTGPLLECLGVGKRFGGTTALEGVNFAVLPGEIHGVVGTNGAGKSTLMKILAGAVPDYDGRVRIDGAEVAMSNPAEALRRGVAMVYQDLSGVGQLSVAENLFLGRQPTRRPGRIDWPRMRREARQFLAELDIALDVRRRLDRHPLVVRQMVEIARGLHSGARVLILDEPTSSLSPPETQRLFALLGQLKTRGTAVVFISHFIEDVLAICDRVTILRDGRVVETSPSAALGKHEVIQKMLGHSGAAPETGYEGTRTLPERTTVPPCLRVEGLSRRGQFENVSLELAPGECLALYGYVGAGHQELAHALAGALTPSAGRVLLDGARLPPGDISAAVRRGVTLVAADRAQSLVRGTEIYKNVTVAHLRRAVGRWLTRRRELHAARPVLVRVGCRPAAPTLKAGRLSGGNQQKVVLAKWLLGPLRVLVLEEPTRGMDVGAKEEVLRIVQDLKRSGTAVILASTEPELVLAQADRILTFRRGRLTREFAGTSVDKPALLRSV